MHPGGASTSAKSSELIRRPRAEVVRTRAEVVLREDGPLSEGVGPTLHLPYGRSRIESALDAAQERRMETGDRRDRRGALSTSALCVLVASCASYRGEELPERSLAELERAPRLPAITYWVTEAGAVPFLAAAQNVPPTAITTTRVEPLFRRLFVESKATTEAGPLHLDMYFRSTPNNPGVTLVLGLFCIASIGVLPAYGEDDLYLEVKVRRDGVAVKQYLYEESVHTWLHWFALPWAFTHDPEEVTAAAVDQMLLALVADLQRDRALVEAR